LSSFTRGVGDEPEPLPDVRCPDARSRQTDRPDGVTVSFQVIANKVKPAVSNRSRNLLTKEDWRAALADEAMPRWPKMARIGPPPRFSRTTEGLARTTTRPNRSVIGPSGESEGEAPSADAGEEMALGVASEVVGSHIGDRSCINVTFRYLPSFNQFPQPCSGERVEFVIVRGHYGFRPLEFQPTMMLLPSVIVAALERRIRPCSRSAAALNSARVPASSHQDRVASSMCRLRVHTLCDRGLVMVAPPE
jgi:hypothetical protein